MLPKAVLPLPSTTDLHGHAPSKLPLTGTLSRRALKLILSGTLVLSALIFYSSSYASTSSSSGPGRTRIDLDALDRILEEDASSAIIGGSNSKAIPPPSSSEEGLTSLGLEADQSFKLGNTLLGDYKLELEEFVMKAFPKGYQHDAMASLRRHLDDTGAQTSFSPIPHKIWQTAPVLNPGTFQQWQFQSGFDYTFMNDADADKYIKDHFDGSLIQWTWDHLPVGILRSDYLRYLLVCFEGGIYSDTDTNLLKPFDHWGADPEAHDASVGPPSLIVGIEADVGTRADWHKWWPRPLQIVQWTLAGAPFQPVLIDSIRRIYVRCQEIERWKKEQGLSDKAGDDRIREAIKNDERVGSIMEWTGPGVFTDTVIRYLAAEFGVQWPELKDRRTPIRYREVTILPVTGFSPGVGLFGAGEIYDAQAMVHHYFSGSWKHDS